MKKSWNSPGKVLEFYFPISVQTLFVHKLGLPIIISYFLSCRYNGRQILYLLMTHQDFDKMLSKHLPANTLRNIRDIVETLKVKVRYIVIDFNSF